MDPGNTSKLWVRTWKLYKTVWTFKKPSCRRNTLSFQLNKQTKSVNIKCFLFIIYHIVLVTRCSSDWPGLCAILITVLSLLLVLVTFPLSLLVTVKVVKEYERAVIFRLGRLLSGGARGPGIFFVLPCVDSYSKVRNIVITVTWCHLTPGGHADCDLWCAATRDSHPGLCDHSCWRNHVLQGRSSQV